MQVRVRLFDHPAVYQEEVQTGGNAHFLCLPGGLDGLPEFCQVGGASLRIMQLMNEDKLLGAELVI